MPGFDKTGPAGQGRMTGRKLGACNNYGQAEKTEDIPNENSPGRGLGQGRRGAGKNAGNRGTGKGRRSGTGSRFGRGN